MSFSNEINVLGISHQPIREFCINVSENSKYFELFIYQEQSFDNSKNLCSQIVQNNHIYTLLLSHHVYHFFKHLFALNHSCDTPSQNSFTNITLNILLLFLISVLTVTIFAAILSYLVMIKRNQLTVYQIDNIERIYKDSRYP